MSSSQLEEMLERERDEAVAAALGISVDDLDMLEWSIDDHCSNDGLLYGHNITFGPGSDPAVLAEIKGLGGANWIRIPPLVS